MSYRHCLLAKNRCHLVSLGWSIHNKIQYVGMSIWHIKTQMFLQWHWKLLTKPRVVTSRSVLRRLSLRQNLWHLLFLKFQLWICAKLQKIHFLFIKEPVFLGWVWALSRKVNGARDKHWSNDTGGTCPCKKSLSALDVCAEAVQCPGFTLPAIMEQTKFVITSRWLVPGNFTSGLAHNLPRQKHRSADASPLSCLGVRLKDPGTTACF